MIVCNKENQHGFSLIELAIVMVISSLLLTTFLSMLQQSNREKLRKEFDKKFDLISLALTHYTYDEPGIEDPVRFPCPASLTKRSSDNEYGFEQCFLGNYEKRNARILRHLKPGDNFNGVFVLESIGDEPSPKRKHSKVKSFSLRKRGDRNKSFVLIGAIPAHTLGIPVDNMIDPYGNRYFYAVTLSLTEEGALLTSPALSGAIKILNESNSDITSTARFFVFSSGEDQAGSFLQSGRESGIECRTSYSGDSRNCLWQYDELAVFKTQDGFSLGSQGYYYDDWTMTRLFSDQDAAGWWQSLDEGGKNITMKNQGALIIGNINSEDIDEEDKLVVDGNIRTKQIVVVNQTEDKHGDNDDKEKWECIKKRKGVIRYKDGILEFCNGKKWKKILTGGIMCQGHQAIESIADNGKLRCINVVAP